MFRAATQRSRDGAVRLRVRAILAPLRETPALVAVPCGVIGTILLFAAVVLPTAPPPQVSYTSHTAPGLYACAACGSVLFDSDDKFRSTTRWPSFRRAVDGAVATRPDHSFGLDRVEALCARCGAHLGHVFADGRLAGDDHPEADRRFCLLSSSLRFLP
jgi:methionine-R-sulfoxide reductase